MTELEKSSRKDLLSLCKEYGLAKYGNKNKADLIELINTHRASMSPTPPTLPTPPTHPETEPETEPEAEETNELILETPPPLGTLPLGAKGLTKNTFHVGDNLDLLKRVGTETIDMLYLDPPYNTGRNFYYFQDKFSDFSKFMEERLRECARVLKKDGNIIIHVEPRISHHIRVICDKLFGENHFQNEIVWHSGGNAKNKYQLGRNHDTIIVYGKSAKPKFFPLYKPYDDAYKKGLKKCPIHNKMYSTSAAHSSQPEVNPRPNLRYEWNGHSKQWHFSKEKMQTLHDDNRLEYNGSGVPRIKRFIEEMEGIPVRDTWDDISSIQNGEKTKYATQKPVKLLERIVKLYSAEGDLCLDPFGGSGTLGRACKTLKRDYLLFDINPEAKQVFEGSATGTDDKESESP